MYIENTSFGIVNSKQDKDSISKFTTSHWSNSIADVEFNIISPSNVLIFIQSIFNSLAVGIEFVIKVLGLEQLEISSFPTHCPLARPFKIPES